MLFNDFLLLTRIKRPLLTKVIQLINRITFNYQHMSIKPIISINNDTNLSTYLHKCGP